MKTIQVFDPALCCSSGVCGVDVDQALVDFSADVDWAKAQGAQIERFNLAQQPMEFAKRVAVTEALQRDGNAALPLFLVEGKVMMSSRYPTRDELHQWLGLAAQTAVPVAPVTVQASTSSCRGSGSKPMCC